MKFFGTFITLGLALGALAEPIPRRVVKRDVQVFLDTLSTINEQVGVLQTAVTEFAGDDTDLKAASDELITRIDAGTEAVTAEPELTSTETLSLATPINELTDTTNDSVDAIIEKEPDFIEAGLEGEVLETLNKQKTSSTALGEAIVGKVPEELKDTATKLAAGITDAIQRGIDAYSD